MKKYVVFALVLALIVCVFSGCEDLQSPSEKGENQNSAGGSSLSLTIAETRPSCGAFEYYEPNVKYCLYAFDDEGALYRVLWTDWDGLNEKDRIVVEYSDIKELEPGAGSGWSPQYEVTATRVSLAGASDQTDAAAFSFSYKLEKTEYRAGDRIAIEVKVTNTSGKGYSYTGSSSGFLPAISLYYISGDDQKMGHIEHEPYPMTDDYVQYVIVEGMSGTGTYYFTVPQDAVCAAYSITLSYQGVTKDFVGVLNIVE